MFVVSSLCVSPSPPHYPPSLFVPTLGACRLGPLRMAPGPFKRAPLYTGWLFQWAFQHYSQIGGEKEGEGMGCGTTKGGCFKTSVAFGVVNEYVHVRVCVGIFDYKIYRDLAARLKWIKRFESTLLQQSGYQACTAKTKLLFLHRKLWAHNEFEPLFASKHHASLPVTRHSVLLTRDQRSFRFRDSCAP